MSDGTYHGEDPDFEEFVERELNDFANRAEEQNICIDCLTDRIIVEMVASLTRAGISSRDILSMVLDGLDLAATADDTGDAPRRMH